jgi:hypothetical protein
MLANCSGIEKKQLLMMLLGYTHSCQSNGKRRQLHQLENKKKNMAMLNVSPLFKFKAQYTAGGGGGPR